MEVRDIGIAPADRSVGIMADYLDDFSLFDEHGAELTSWYDDLTDDEYEQIGAAVWAAQDEWDPTPWCHGCGAMKEADCHCGPLAENE